jgi:hypothetical protein
VVFFRACLNTSGRRYSLTLSILKIVAMKMKVKERNSLIWQQFNAKPSSSGSRKYARFSLSTKKLKVSNPVRMKTPRCLLFINISAFKWLL